MHWAGHGAWKRARFPLQLSRRRQSAEKQSISGPAGKRKVSSLSGVTQTKKKLSGKGVAKVTRSQSSVDAGLAHCQVVGQLECHHQRFAVEQLVTTMHVVKTGRTICQSGVLGELHRQFAQLFHAPSSSSMPRIWHDIGETAMNHTCGTTTALCANTGRSWLARL